MKLHHIGFGKEDLGNDPPKFAFLSGQPERSRFIAQNYLKNAYLLSNYRGLDSYLGLLSNNLPVLAATSGMGAPSLSIVVNELIQVGITHIIRIGTCGSIQSHVLSGSLVITQAALCRQGAANDIAPLEYPATADPFLTVALVEAARELEFDYHLGITASVDTFYEGQERYDSANANLQSWLRGITQEYRHLNILNYEMESGTLLKMAGVYGFAAGCICAVVAQRTEKESIVSESQEIAIHKAIQVALRAVENLQKL